MSHIIYRSGNLLTAGCDVIIHGCNCFNTMGAGIARQIRDKYPAAYSADLATIRGDKSKLGSFTYAFVNGQIIINLYSQFHYGFIGGQPPIDYQALAKGFSLVHNFISSQRGNKSSIRVGIPKIGAGLAGGDWPTIEAIINKVWSEMANPDYSGPIEVWTL